MKKNNYYAGGLRFVRDGVPCKMAAWVKDLTPVGRAGLLRGTDACGMSGPAREAAAMQRYPQTTYTDATY